MANNKNSRVPFAMFSFSIITFVFIWGIAVGRFEVFPHSFFVSAGKGFAEIFSQFSKFSLWYYQPTKYQESITIADRAKIQPGLTKITQIDGDRRMSVKIIDIDGELVHHWKIGWFSIWPDVTHLTDIEIPQSLPGTHIHGAEIDDDANLVFNFEHLGLVKLDACGNILWKLPYRTHHSVFVDDDGNYWVSAQKNHYTKTAEFPLANPKPKYVEEMILKVSPEGEILLEKSIPKLLEENGLIALTLMSTQRNWTLEQVDDTLHLNDVEVFSRDMAPGFFQPGDVMISLRNIHSVIVFDSQWQLKYRSTGHMVRQHDPDFVDGNTLSFFDNNNVGPVNAGHSSLISMHDVVNDEYSVAFSGSKDFPFYTQIMGKHQWLQNGNLIFTESMHGRALEVSPDGKLLWQYINIVEPGITGVVEEAERLPAKKNAEFFRQASLSCDKPV